MGILTSSSTNVFTQSREEVYDCVSNPVNWTRAFPGSEEIAGLPDRFPLEIGDTWTEIGQLAEGEKGKTAAKWYLALAIRPRIWVFSSIGNQATDVDGNGGFDTRTTVEYRFLESGGLTLFQRTMTIETFPESPVPDFWFAHANPQYIDTYHAAIKKLLEG